MLTLTPEQRAELDAIDQLADAIAKVFPTADLDLQPATRACYLAAQAALAVIQAHELGQEVEHPAPAATRSNSHHAPRAITRGPKATCPECGKTISASQLSNHRHKKHAVPART